MSEFSLPVRVYIEDTDAGGIVYYVNYLKFMERARTELLRSYGYDKPALWSDDAIFVVHSVEVNYRKPAKLSDGLEVTARIVEVGRAYVIFSQQVLRDGEVLCEGTTKVANVRSDNMKPAALPKEMRALLQEKSTPANS